MMSEVGRCRHTTLAVLAHACLTMARRRATGRGANKPHRSPTPYRARGPAAALVARFGFSRRTQRRSSTGRLARCSIRNAPTDAIGKTSNNPDDHGKDDGKTTEDHTTEP